MFSRNHAILLAGLVMALVILIACVPLPPAQPAVPTSAALTEAPADKPAPVPPPTDELRMLRVNSWQWVWFEGSAGRVEIEDPASYRATFNTDASLAIAADCNNLAGSYQGEGGNLTIEIGPMTLAACPPAPESRSGEFIDGLRSAVSYAFEGENLKIEVALEGGSGTMVFVPADAPAEKPAPVPPPTDELVLLRANSWQWISFEDTAGRVEIADPTSYRATFNTDASLGIAADCNNAAGSYQGEGGNLTIDIGQVTRAACAPESRSQQFIELLAAAVRYAFEGQNLRIEVAGESSSATMVFAPTDEAVISPEKASEAVTPAALADTLGNLSYNGILPNQPVTLTNGTARYDDGSSAQPTVRLIDHLIARGDLNGDGVEDAVVLLEDDTSGTGRFVYAAAVLDAAGNPTPTEAVLLGDRIQVKSLAIEGSEVVADLVAQGPGDAACCASWNVRKVFALEDGRLTERRSEELSKISLADLNGTKWWLVDLNGDREPVLPEAEITMLLADGQISGSAGCNDYNSTVSSEADSPSSCVVGAIATSKKLCPEPVMNQESSYLARLGKAVAWWLDGGRLALTYEAPEGGFGNLVFDPAGSQFAAVPFDLGEAVVTQDWVANEKFRNLPVRLNGLIAAPPTGENLPIAIIIHGSHGTGCSAPDGVNERWPCPDRELRHYEGFAYLLEALAARGYVAISINANPAFVMAYGGSSPNRRLPALFDLYMTKIAAAVNGEDVGLGVDLAGRVDLNQLVALGHSAGGEGLTQVVDGRAGRTMPEQVSAGQGPIAAAILLAPSRSAIPGIETALSFAVILPACDRDVADLGGQGYYEEVRMRPERAALTASVYLPGANHNRFNAALGDESLGRASAICDGTLLPAAAQRAFLADYALHFYDAALGRGDAPAALAGLDPTQPAPATLFDRAVLTSLAMPTPQRLRLPSREGAATGAAAAVFCKAGYGEPGELAEACRRVQFNQPGNPEQLALTWDGTDGAYEVALPEGNRDLSDYATLHLRAAVDPLSPLNEPGKPQSFSLRLTDGAGKTAAVALTGEPALAFPAGVKEGVNSFNLDTWDNHVILSSIRAPLARFAGVDLGEIRSVALVFDATERGAIFMTDLELLRTDMMHTEHPKSDTSKPAYVSDLEAAYGAPSQAGWGSAVFYERLQAGDDLGQAALAKYKFFTGNLGQRYGEEAWLGPWKEVYARQAGAKPDIVAELRSITDPDARNSVPMILDNIEGADKARAALAAAYDDPAVTELRVFNLGDGGAMSGILVAGRRGATGEATFLVFLLD